MKENKNWSQHEDKILKMLREEQGLKKWSVIAQKMEEDFKIIGKSGKKCRERYQSHLNKDVKQDEWTTEEEVALFRLHNQKGNRWVEIAKALERSDNAVKNHYHSKLRKALRKINSLLTSHFKNQFKPLKNNIISKVLQTAQNYINHPDALETTQPKLCFSLKNKILDYLWVSDKLDPTQQLELKIMVKEINQFNKVFKKKKHSSSGVDKEFPKTGKYKGKQILKLINQNRNKNESLNKESSSEEEEESESFKSSSSYDGRKKKDGFKSAVQKNFNNEGQRNTHSLPMRNFYPSYPFSFVNRPYEPTMFNLLSYNYLINSAPAFSPFAFSFQDHMMNGTQTRIPISQPKVKKEQLQAIRPQEGL